MTIPRTLEPEVMESKEDAQDYDAMDHKQVNRLFVEDLLAAANDLGEAEILDLGTGTAQIPIELCRLNEDCRVMASDLSINMLDLARYNIEVAGLIQRIQLDHVDSKSLHYNDGQFQVVMSNSIVHHIPEPLSVIREAVRVLAPNGMIFFRDLLRPGNKDELEHLVLTYTGHENEHAQKLFADSLHAALTLDEMRELVAKIGFNPDHVNRTSDRHWTWIGRRG